MKPTVEQQIFRQVLGSFATGVTVISFLRGGEVCGMTVNSFCSVSLDPPLVLFCPALTTRFALESIPGEPFTISVLAQDQKRVCMHFAGQGTLDSSPWEGDAPPVIKGCLAWLRCETRAVHTHGDHLVVIAEVQEFAAHRDASPLLFFRGGYPILSVGAEGSSNAVETRA